MENEYTKLIDIRFKMSAGITLTKTEKSLWNEWINRPYVRDFPLYNEEIINDLKKIRAQRKPFEEYWKELEELADQSRQTPPIDQEPGSHFSLSSIHAWILGQRRIAVVCIIILTGIVVTFWSIFLDKGTSHPEVTYITVTVPPQENLQVILPDSSIVWLNAGSTLRYPSRFDTNKRIVELNGEGYFDVKHLHDNTPLYVLTDNQEIKVTGTKFNVDDYSNNKFKKTTLLEGSVIIKAKSGTEHPYLLKPGERSVMVNNSEFTVERLPKPGQATAWKRDSFDFDNTPLTEIMNKLENWYEVKIVFEEGVKDKRYTVGPIARKQPITWVLQVLESTGGFKFKRTGIDIKKGDVIRIMKSSSNTKEESSDVHFANKGPNK